jgi:hypothetical protein
MKNKRDHTVGTAPKSKGKIDTPNTHMYDRSLSRLGTGTSLKSGSVKFVCFDCL